MIEAKTTQMIFTPKREFVGFAVDGDTTLENDHVLSYVLDVCGASLPCKQDENFIPFKTTLDVKRRVGLFDIGPHSVLVFSAFGIPKVPEIAKSLTVEQKTKKFICFWDSRTIAVAAMGPNKEVLKDLLRAFNKKDILFGGRFKERKYEPFLGGFRVLIASKINQSDIETSKEYYIGTVKMNENIMKAKAAEKIDDILIKLSASGKYWKSLKFIMRKGEVLINIVPSNLELYNHGIFQLPALKLWLKDEGPIIKNGE